MRLLAEDEDKADREERRLDLSMLDVITWPEFVWDWLRLVGGTPILPYSTNYGGAVGGVEGSRRVVVAESSSRVVGELW